MEDEYLVVIDWLWCSFSISLLSATIQSIHGVRSSFQHHVLALSLMDLVRVECNLTLKMI